MTDKEWYRAGVGCGLGAAAEIARRLGRTDVAEAIDQYERKTTDLKSFFMGKPEIPEMHPSVLGIGMMTPQDLGLTEWPTS